MKKIVGIYIVLSVLLLTACGGSQDKTLIDFSAHNIASVELNIQPPNRQITLNKKQVEKLVQMINQVKIGEEESTYLEYTGQWVEFDILFDNNTLTKIAILNPYIIVNEKGYSANESILEELNAFANELLD